MKTPPVTVIRSSLIVNPVSQGLYELDSATFRDVLVKAIAAPRPIGSAPVHSQNLALIDDRESKSGDFPNSRQLVANGPLGSQERTSPARDPQLDLYARIDLMLREKSILLAIV